MNSIKEAQRFGEWALNAAAQGREGAAYVWAFSAFHFARKALDGGAILTAEGWKIPPAPVSGFEDWATGVGVFREGA